MEELFRGALIVITGLGVYIWKAQTKKQDDFERRILEIEKNSVSKKDFSDFKEELKNDFNTIIKTLNGMNDKLVTREVARDIAKNEVLDSILKHQNECPFKSNNRK
jgi:hypothetical protein